MAKQYSVREMQRILTNNGFKHKRTNGSHAIYSNGQKTIPLPVSNLNFKIAIKILKQCNLAIN